MIYIRNYIEIAATIATGVTLTCRGSKIISTQKLRSIVKLPVHGRPRGGQRL